MYIYMHIYICEKLFTERESLNLALASEAHFLEWRLTPFGKELFICSSDVNLWWGVVCGCSGCWWVTSGLRWRFGAEQWLRRVRNKLLRKQFSVGRSAWVRPISNIHEFSSQRSRPDGITKWVEHQSPILVDWEIWTLRVWSLVESNQWLKNLYWSHLACY